MDTDAQHVLKNVTPDHLKSLNPKISQSTAVQASKAVSYLMSLTSKKIPTTPENSHLFRRNDQELNSPFVYNFQKNHAHSYVIQSNTTIKSARPLHFTKKIFEHFQEPLESDWWSNRLQKRDQQLVARDDDSKWALLHGEELSLVTQDDRKGDVSYAIVSSMEHAWDSVVTILRRIGITIKVCSFLSTYLYLLFC